MKIKRPNQNQLKKILDDLYIQDSLLSFQVYRAHKELCRFKKTQRLIKKRINIYKNKLHEIVGKDITNSSELCFEDDIF